jgi:hypothetical protein
MIATHDWEAKVHRTVDCLSQKLDIVDDYRCSLGSVNMYK